MKRRSKRILCLLCCMLAVMMIYMLQRRSEQKIVIEETKRISSDRLAYRHGGLWGLADAQGNMLTQPSWEDVEAQNPESTAHDPIVVTVKDKEEERQGLIDVHGNEILPAEWGRLERMDSGVCIAWKDELFRGACCTFSPKGELIETLPENTWTEALYEGAAYNILYGYLPDGRYGWFALGRDGRIALMCAEEEWKAEAQDVVYEDGCVYVCREDQVGFMAMDGSVLTDESWKSFELYNGDYGIVRNERNELVCVGLRGQKTLVFPKEYGAGRPVCVEGKWYIPLAIYDQEMQRLMEGWADEDGMIVREFE